MLEFDGSNASGATMAVGNYTEGDYPLNGWIANLEAYDTVHMCEDFIRARMKFLADQYGVKDTPYGKLDLERETWELLDDGVDTRKVSPEQQE